MKTELQQPMFMVDLTDTDGDIIEKGKSCNRSP